MIKKFNEYIINEEINPLVGIDKTKMFYDGMKKITEYDESEYEQGDEPSRADLADEVGDLMDKMLMTTDDLQQVVDKYPNDIDVEYYVKGQLEYELKHRQEEQSLEDILKKHGVNDINGLKKDLKKIGYGITLT
jgi:hypothetical protein